MLFETSVEGIVRSKSYFFAQIIKRIGLEIIVFYQDSGVMNLYYFFEFYEGNFRVVFEYIIQMAFGDL